MTPEQLKQAEDLVNDAIRRDLPITCEEMSVEEAKKSGAMGLFENKYTANVKVYTMATPARRSVEAPMRRTPGNLVISGSSRRRVPVAAYVGSRRCWSTTDGSPAAINH